MTVIIVVTTSSSGMYSDLTEVVKAADADQGRGAPTVLVEVAEFVYVF